MYDSLFSAHVGRYYLENYCVLDCTRESLHECIRECMHCRVMGSPSVSLPAAIKGEGEAFARTTNCLAAMAYPWCSCSRPPEVCVVLSSKRC